MISDAEIIELMGLFVLVLFLFVGYLYTELKYFQRIQWKINNAQGKVNNMVQEQFRK